ncbi:MAG: glycosyltransferase [Candidatus Sabulitectum sp.]|nr:glycosyltransferase [Candidatus Sabulitectum sp.]
MFLNKLQPLIEKCGTVDLVIPVYNEETILKSQLEPVLKQLPEGFSVTVVENGSTDATISILNTMKIQNPGFKVISLGEPSYGNAVRNGLESSSADILIVDDLDVLDTDFWLTGLDIMVEGSTDMVQGSKVLAGKNDKRPFLRRAATRVLTSLLRLLLGFKGTDTHGPKIMKRSSMASIFPLCGHEPDLYPSELIIRAQRAGLVIRELPIKLEEIRETPLALHKRVPRAIRDLFRLRAKLGSS